jgi:hypothetical protein
MAEVSFSIKISGVEGVGLPASIDPYFRLDFDHLKEHRSAHLKKGTAFRWPDALEFEYQSKYAQRLPTKEMAVEVWDKRTLAADRIVGEGRVCLYALFTGPRQVEIALEDREHKPAGMLRMTIAIEQTVSLAATVTGLTVDLDDAAAPTVDVTIASTLPALMRGAAEAAPCDVPSRVAGGQVYTPASELRTSRAMLQTSSIFRAAVLLVVKPRGGGGGGELRACLPVHKFFR